MRITFKRVRGCGTCPPEAYDVRVDGQRVGTVSELWDGMLGTMVGWYWYVRSEELGVPWKNTSAEKLVIETLDEAKAQVTKHLRSTLEAKP